MKPNSIPIRPSLFGASRIVTQVDKNLPTCVPRIIPCRRHVHNLPVHQFRLALHLVQVFYCGACFGTHGCPPSPRVCPIIPARKGFGGSTNSSEITLAPPTM